MKLDNVTLSQVNDDADFYLEFAHIVHGVIHRLEMPLKGVDKKTIGAFRYEACQLKATKDQNQTWVDRDASDTVGKPA